MINKLQSLREARQKGQSGFTIIEVLIVLAIAGLIMLIVFLAVPALQRNSRNTARKNDAARIGGAVTEFVSNNNGRTPTAGSAADVTAIMNSAGNLSQYTSANFSIAAATNTGAQTNLSNIQLRVSSKCDTANAGQTTGGTTRQMALVYMVEGGSTNTGVCQEI